MKEAKIIISSRGIIVRVRRVKIVVASGKEEPMKHRKYLSHS